MATPVNPLAFQNAFDSQVDRGLRNRLAQQQQVQQVVENQHQNRLMQMRQTEFSSHQNRLAQQDQFATQDRDVAQRERQRQVFTTQLAPFARRAIESGRARAFVGAALADPAFHSIFRDAGFDPANIDVNSPDFMQSLESIAGMAGQGGPGADQPSSVREWEYYNSLSQPDQQRYLEMKRAQQGFMARNEGVQTYFRPGVAGGEDRVAPIGTLGGEANAAALVAGAETEARETARADVAAAFDLPAVEEAAAQALSVIDQLIDHPGLQYVTGLASKLPTIPGTSQAAARALANQFEGIVYLNAYQQLKGGGHITEFEGQKAAQAKARIERAQNINDYRAALREYRQIIESGLRRARADANRGAAGSRGAQPPQGSGNQAVRVSSPAEAARLPSGTRFVTPDGEMRVKR